MRFRHLSNLQHVDQATIYSTAVAASHSRSNHTRFTFNGCSISTRWHRCPDAIVILGAQTPPRLHPTSTSTPSPPNLSGLAAIQSSRPLVYRPASPDNICVLKSQIPLTPRRSEFFGVYTARLELHRKLPMSLASYVKPWTGPRPTCHSMLTPTR